MTAKWPQDWQELSDKKLSNFTIFPTALSTFTHAICRTLITRDQFLKNVKLYNPLVNDVIRYRPQMKRGPIIKYVLLSFYYLEFRNSNRV